MTIALGVVHNSEVTPGPGRAAGGSRVLRPESASTCPRDRLRGVATGTMPLQLADLQAVVADHLLAADAAARLLSDRLGQLVELLLDAQARGNLDPRAVLDLLRGLQALHCHRSTELRRTVELLHHISGPPHPAIKVIAIGGEGVNIAAQQVVQPVDLGGRRQ
jgi:hypothetical protein